MAKKCDVCGKGHQIGYNVSHANNKTKKTWQPNLQSIKVITAEGTKRMKVCTQCIKSNRVKKAAA